MQTDGLRDADLRGGSGILVSQRLRSDSQTNKPSSVRSRLTEISDHVRIQLNDADWTTKREIIRALIQRIEIGPTKVAVVLRLPTDTSPRGLDPIMVTLSRA
jgi:hypothetical protein